MAHTPTTEIEHGAASTTTNNTFVPHAHPAHGGALDKLQFDKHPCDSSSSDEVLFIRTPPPKTADNDDRVDNTDGAVFEGDAIVTHDDIAASKTVVENVVGVSQVLKGHCAKLDRMLHDAEVTLAAQKNFQIAFVKEKEAVPDAAPSRNRSAPPNRSVNSMPQLDILRQLAENDISLSSVSGDISAGTVQAENEMFVRLLMGARTVEIDMDLYPESLAALQSAYDQRIKLELRAERIDRRSKAGKAQSKQLSTDLQVMEGVILGCKVRALKERKRMGESALVNLMKEYKRVHQQYKRLQQVANESFEERQARLTRHAARERARAKTTRNQPLDEAVLEDDGNDDDKDVQEVAVRAATEAIIADLAAIAATKATPLNTRKRAAAAAVPVSTEKPDPPMPAPLPVPVVNAARGAPFPAPVTEALQSECLANYANARFVSVVCGVCDQWRNPHTCEIVPLTWPSLAVLVPPHSAALPPQLTGYYAAPPAAHANIMLAPGGYVDAGGHKVAATNDAQVRVCAVCIEALNRKKPSVPQCAIANGNWYGGVPDVLEALSSAEQRVTGLVIARACVTQLQKSGGGAGSLALRGRVSFFASQPLARNVTAWPREREHVKQHSTVVVVFSGQKTELHKLPQLREHVVDVARIDNAFVWLQQFNHLYRPLKRDQAAWADYVKQANEPLCTIEQVDETAVNPAVQLEGAAFPNANHDDAPADANDGPVVTGLIEPASRINGVTTKEGWLDSVAQQRSSSTGQPLNVPDNETAKYACVSGALFKDKDWDSRGYPWLLPYGRGGIGESHRHHPVAKDKTIANMLNHSSNRFVNCPSFIFAAFDCVRCDRLMRSAAVGISASHLDDIDANCVVQLPDVIAALDRDQARKNARAAGKEDDTGAPPDARTHVAHAADKLLSAMNITMRSDPWQDGTRKVMRNNVTALITTFGIPTFFITVNPSDINDIFRVRFSNGAEFDVNNNAAIRAFVAQHKSTMYMEALRDPGACVAAVTQSFMAFVNQILLGGAYGKIKMFCFSIECQCRGSLHYHGLVWIENAPISNAALQSWLTDAETVADGVQRAATAKQRQEAMCAFHDSVVTSSLPVKSAAPTEALAAIEADDDEQLLSQRYIIQEWDALTDAERQHRLSELTRHIAQSVQMHPIAHAEVCKKKNNKGGAQVECRFYFPRERVDGMSHMGSGERCTDQCAERMTAFNESELTAQLAEVLSVHTHRAADSLWLNPFNAVASISLRCNNDVKLVLGRNNAAAAYYITKYITKTSGVECALIHAAAATQAIPRALERNPGVAGPLLAKKMVYGSTAFVNASEHSALISLAAALSTTLALAGKASSPYGEFTALQAPGEFVAPVEFANIPALQGMAFLKREDQQVNLGLGNLRADKDPDAPSDLFKAQGLLNDYINRSPALEQLCMDRFVSDFVVTGAKYKKNAPTWYFLPEYARSNTHVIQQRTTAAVAVPRCVDYLPSAFTDEARALNTRALTLIVLYVPFRTPIDTREGIDGDELRTGVRRIVWQAAADDDEHADDHQRLESFAEAFERLKGEITPESLAKIANSDAFSDARRAAQEDRRRRIAEGEQLAPDDDEALDDERDGQRDKRRRKPKEPFVGTRQTASVSLLQSLFGGGELGDDDDEDDENWLQFGNVDNDFADVPHCDKAQSLIELPAWCSSRSKLDAGFKKAFEAQRAKQPTAAFADLRPNEAATTIIETTALDANGGGVPLIAARQAQNVRLVNCAAEFNRLTDGNADATLLFDPTTGKAAPAVHQSLEALLTEVSAGLNLQQRAAFYTVAHRSIEQFLWCEQRRKQIADHGRGARCALPLPPPTTPFPPPITVLMLGEGGTGKSFVVLALQQLFALLDRSAQMRTCAFMASAAVNVNGSTIHSLFGLTLRQKTGPSSAQAIADLEMRIGAVRLVVVDEISAVSAPLFSSMLQQICTVAEAQSRQTHGLFAGQFDRVTHAHGFLNLLVSGDFGQLPPPGSSAYDCMYFNPKCHSVKSGAAATTRAAAQAVLYNTSHVVQLQQQHRVSDPISAEALARIRSHEATAADAELLEARRIDPHAPDYQAWLERWLIEKMITPDSSESSRNAIIVSSNLQRLHLNRTIFHLWARHHPDAQIWVFQCIDTFRYATNNAARQGAAVDRLAGSKRPRADVVDDNFDDNGMDDDNHANANNLDLPDDCVEPQVVAQLQTALLHMPPTQTVEMPTALQCAIGVPVCITFNQGKNNTAIGTSRNATGTIVAIFEDRTAQNTKRNGVIYSDKPPKGIMVLLDGALGRQLTIDGLPQGCVLLKPETAKQNFKLNAAVVDKARADAGLVGRGPHAEIVVKRFGMGVDTGAWALTTYKVQGRTCLNTLVFADKLDLWYVPLSRTASFANISVVSSAAITAAMLNGKCKKDNGRAQLANFMASVAVRSAATIESFAAQWPAAAASAPTVHAKSTTTTTTTTTATTTTTTAATSTSTATTTSLGKRGADATFETPQLASRSISATSTAVRAPQSRFDPAAAAVPTSLHVANWHDMSCATDQLWAWVHMMFSTSGAVQFGVAIARDALVEHVQLEFEYSSVLLSETDFMIVDQMQSLTMSLVLELCARPDDDDEARGAWFEIRDRVHGLLTTREANAATYSGSDVTVPYLVLAVASFAKLGTSWTLPLFACVDVTWAADLSFAETFASFVATQRVGACTQLLLMNVSAVFRRIDSATNQLVPPNHAMYANNKHVVPLRLTTTLGDDTVLAFTLSTVLHFNDGISVGHFFGETMYSPQRAMQMRVGAGVWLSDLLKDRGSLSRTNAWTADMQQLFDQGGDAADVFPCLRVCRNDDSNRYRQQPMYLLYERVGNFFDAE